MAIDLLENLNEQQRQAVTTTEGPMLVIAGAGSGKTRVITHRIAWLIREKGVAPWQIFAATFTNKAAEEMRQRVERLVPEVNTGRLAISTFHSQCVSILRREAAHVGLTSRFNICDDTDQMALIKDCLKNLDVPASVVKPEGVRDYIAAAKILMLDPAQAVRELPHDAGSICSRIYEQYQQRLLMGDAVDFDDLILHVVRIFQQQPDVLESYHRRWPYLLVDEYQDTNRVQFEFVRLLAGGHGNICVVGDEDQSIYSWRGAEIENLLTFPERFDGAKIVQLSTNYRSTDTVLEAASAVISHNSQRLEGKSDLTGCRGPGEQITMIIGHNERDEAAQTIQTIRWLHEIQGRRLSQMAIFYRVNALSRSFEDQLRQYGLPYKVVGGIKFYDRAEVKDMLAYLRVLVNPRDSIALARIINKPTRGVGPKSVNAIFDGALDHSLSAWDYLCQNIEKGIPGLSKKAKAGLCDLMAMVAQWADYAENHEPHQVLERILSDTQYDVSLGKENDIEAISRRENLSELVTAMQEFHQSRPDASLTEFLEQVALVNATDDLSHEESISLMTLHTAKGLEYDVVFLAGMEDPLFPSQRAVAEAGHFEEERRLFYVGITRARDLLFLTRADCRSMYGRANYNPPSVFLREVPGELVRTLEDARQEWAEADERGGARPARFNSSSAPQRDNARRHGRTAAPEPPEDGGGLFEIGQRVVHARLGEGAVVRASGSGQNRKVTVRFDAGLELEILEQYGGLRQAEQEDLPY